MSTERNKQSAKPGSRAMVSSSLRIGRFQRTFVAPRREHRVREAAAKVSRAAARLGAATKISSAAAQISALEQIVLRLRAAARHLPSVPYSPACPHYQLAFAYICIGKCLERSDNFRGAAGAYRAALRAAPYSVEARLLLANAIRDEAQHQSDLKAAERLLREALDANSALEEQLFAQRVYRRTAELDRETQAAAAAERALAMLLAQEGRAPEACIHMRRLAFRYQLANEVLHYAEAGAPSSAFGGAALAESLKTCSRYAAIVDAALPSSMSAHLLKIFAPTSSFWREHDYANPQCGYFSYLHPLPGAAPDNATLGATTLDAIIQHVHRMVCEQLPAVRRARYAEWWAHCRRHSRGHQLHFDSDNEGEGADGPRHPIISTVVYLTCAVGGPTLITNQTLKSDRLADQGWLIHPRENRLAMFDGNVLHGVIPGRSFPADAASGVEVRAPDGGLRRTTFMIAFWEDIVSAQKRPDGRPGAAIPFPGSPLATTAPAVREHLDSIGVSRHAWPRLVQTSGDSAIASDNRALLSEWARAPTRAIDAGAVSSSSSKSPSVPHLGRPAPVSRVWDAVGGTASGQRALLAEMPSYNVCFQGF